jgi:phosphate transport system protein
MPQHTVKSFEDELNALSEEVASLGGLAEAQVQDALNALVKRDAVIAQRVIDRDPQLDAAQRDIEQKVIKILALRQPVAVDLRATFAALKLAGELERIGDLAKNIAKRSLALNQTDPVQLTRSIGRMGRMAAQQLRIVLDAYGRREPELARQVWYNDESLDEHYNSVFRELITYMAEDMRTIGPCTQLHFIAKNFERMGDHATNIAEVVHYFITGSEIGHDRPKGVGVQPEL